MGRSALSMTAREQVFGVFKYLSREIRQAGCGQFVRQPVPAYPCLCIILAVAERRDYSLPRVYNPHSFVFIHPWHADGIARALVGDRLLSLVCLVRTVKSAQPVCVASAVVTFLKAYGSCHLACLSGNYGGPWHHHNRHIWHPLLEPRIDI